MPTYNILLMGASYGSLLASKLLFGGHKLHLVCLPAEADLINAEGFRVRLPVRGRKDPVVLDFAQASRRRHRRTGHGRQSQRLRSGRAVHAGAAIPLGRRARTARRGGQIARAVHVDHEHAAAALRQAHPGPGLRRAQARLYRPDRVGLVRSRDHHAQQPRPAGDSPAGREGQRADGDAADQFQSGEIRRPEADRHAAAAAGRDRGHPV